MIVDFGLERFCLDKKFIKVFLIIAHKY